MSFNTFAVANQILKFASEEGRQITPMQIQKMLYFIHGWHLAEFKTPLINDEFEAWKHGPVVRKIYREFRRFGDNPITRYAETPGHIAPIFLQSIDETGETTKFVEEFFDLYKEFHPFTLSTESHKVGGPWYNVREDHMKEFGTIPDDLPIPDRMIREYFEYEIQRLEKANEIEKLKSNNGQSISV
jgi:uncharacterized phage-associated protein